MSSFEYSYRREVPKRDENGKLIPLMRDVKKEDGTIEKIAHPGKFEMQEKWFTDFMNLDLYIRTYTNDDDSIIVLLRDGHEVTQKTPTIKGMTKKGPEIVEQKERVWMQSEILIEKPEEVEKLRQALRSK
jgi:hypothetical protein